MKQISCSRHADRPIIHHRQVQHQRHECNRFLRLYLSRWKLCLGTEVANVRLICSPNASCLKRSYDKQNHDTPFSQSKLHSNIDLALKICLVLKEVGSWRASVLRSTHFIANACHQMQFTLRTDADEGWEASLMPATTRPSCRGVQAFL